MQWPVLIGELLILGRTKAETLCRRVATGLRPSLADWLVPVCLGTR